MDNGKLLFPCPKCGRATELRESEDCIDSDNNWNTGKWEEGYTCPSCGAEYTMNVEYDIRITRIAPTWVEGEDE